MSFNRKAIPRLRLDQRLSSMKPESCLPPAKGWIRAIRYVLGMSGVQLGQRIGVKAQSVAAMEKSEVAGTIQLKTLRRAAEALDCVVIYALIPRSSLDNMVQTKAQEVARKELAPIEHTMDLEGQGLSQEAREEQVEIYIRDHVRERDLWEDA